MNDRAAGQDVRVEFRGQFYRGRFDAMASPCELLCEADSADEALQLTRIAADEVWRIESRFSRYRDDNLVHRINAAAGAPVALDAEAERLIGFADELFQLSGGLFDITSGVLRRAWTFDGGTSIPEQAQIDAAIKHVGWDRVSWEPPWLQMPAGMELDLGGIGKEYAVDRAAALVADATDASCLINLGGDLAVTRAPGGFRDWRVGVETGSSRADLPVELLRLRVGAIATSGDSRRFVMHAGRRLGHILDPRTGWPVADAPRSVTVAADTCTEAGMLATLAMLKGAGAERFLDAQGVASWCQRGD